MDVRPVEAGCQLVNLPKKTWGDEGTPILPWDLAQKWGKDPLPAWVRQELHLDPDATFLDLGSRAKVALSERIRSFLTHVMRVREAEIGPMTFGLRRDSVNDLFGSLTLRPRLEGALRKARLLDQPEGELTVERLLSIRNVGPLGVLEFAVAFQMAYPHHLSPDTATPNREADQPPDRKELEAAAQEEWADLVSEHDLRFAKLLPPGCGTLSDRLAQLLDATSARDYELIEAYIAALPAIRHQADKIANQTLEQSLQYLLTSLTGIDDGRLNPLLSRLHWDGGSEAVTLEEAGQRAGVTRERMRQLEKKARDRLPPHPIYLPALKRAIALVIEMAPESATEISRALSTRGISQESFDPASVISAAQDLHLSVGVAVEAPNGIRTVLPMGLGAFSTDLVRIAKKLAGASGVTSVTRVAAWTAKITSHQAGPEEIQRVLDLLCNPEYMDEDRQWFRLPAQKLDPIREISRRMLSATSELTIGSIREGLQRVFRLRNLSVPSARQWNPTAPPKAILQQYFANHNDFVVTQSGSVRSPLPLHMHELLNATELVLVNVLRASPQQFLHRRDLLAETTLRGVNMNSATMQLGYGAMFENLGSGYWMVRGTRVDPMALAAEREYRSASRKSVHLDHGWTPSGQLWIAARAPEVNKNPTPILGLPSAVARYVPSGSYLARSSSGIDCGTIHVYDSAKTTGYAPFLRLSGADAEDILLVRFDLSNATVDLSLIDSDTLDNISQGIDDA